MGFTHIRRKEKAWQKRYDSSAPKIGDAAPDFELSDPLGETAVRLTYFAGKRAVAIIFGSFT